MTEAVFAERRTRSQLTLPDDILHIPDRSPLKSARTAIKNSLTPPKDSADDSEDELLLSPGKQAKPSSSSKRSAEPPPQDEYALGSGPSDGRELKRAKRDLTPPRGNETNIDSLKSSNALRQRLLSGHARTHSDSNVAALLRSTRKRSATTSKKPISTISASPPPTSFSPAATTPKKDRARSVPLFPSTYDLPRIDFRNVPPSPKRSRSPSRSPSKEVELKHRIPSATFFGSSSLPTIHDEAGNSMDFDQDKASSSLVADPTPTEKPAGEGTPLSMHGPTTIVEPGTPTYSAPSTSAIPSIMPTIPATPIAQSLNKLIPLSPLTPLPETPLPPRKASYDDAEDRFVGSLGWELVPTGEPTTTTQSLMPPPTSITPSTSKSNLPRPSMAPPPVPTKSSRPGTMGRSPLPAKSKQPMVPIRNTITSTAKATSKSAVPGKTPKDAFALLMKKSFEAKERSEREKGKSKQNSVKPMLPGLISSSSGGKLSIAAAAGSSQSKIKMKNKMRPKGKVKPERPRVTAPILDEEDEDEDDPSDPWRTPTEMETATEPESEMEADIPSPIMEPTVPSDALEPVERPLVKVAPELMASEVTMQAIDGTRNEDEPMSELPAQDSTMKDTIVPEVEIPPSSVEAAAELRFISPGDEVIPETPPQSTLETPPGAEGRPPIPSENEVISETPQTTPRTRPAAEEPQAEENREEEKSQLEHADSQPASRVNKVPLGKKRQPISVPPVSRVTRSVSNKKLGKEVEAPQPGPSTKANKFIPPKRKPPAAVVKPVPPVAMEISKGVPDIDSPMDVAEDTASLPPGSPMRLGSSPAKTPKRKTPMKSPMKFNLGKPASSPSPTKIARSSTLLSSKPTSSIISRTFSSDYLVNMGASSSLSTLSNALEKLRMPAPSRPSTSMGFNRDASGDDDGPERSKDDTTVGRASLGMGQPARGLKRASTLGTSSFKVPSTDAVASSSKASSSSGKNLVQKPLAMFMSNKGSNAKITTGSVIRGSGKTSVLGSKPLFGVGGGLRRTISKKTTLPVVIGSPVKGGGMEERFGEGEEEEGQNKQQTHAGDDADVFMTTTTNASTALTLEDLDSGKPDKGKAKEESTSKSSNASRRVSMVSHALSQSLNMPPPPPPTRGLMGPPATPPSGRRSASSSYPSTSAGGSSPSTGMRSSARLAKAAEQMKVKASTEGHVPAGKKGAAEPVPPPNPAVEALKVLKDYVIFVDVKTDDGEEAGSLFVEMLEGVGARVLTRVGQTCTHIVYKNGLMSTVTRYRLLRDPKPFVVGIGWVVECVEQRKHVDEKDFLVDLENTNVAGINKRRRSMLPRLLATELSFPSETDKDESGEADQSIDGSNSSMTMNDDLAPLERARRRKSIMVGPRV